MPMMLDFLGKLFPAKPPRTPVHAMPPAPAPVPETIQVGDRTVPLLMVRNLRARRYVLRLRPDGTARVTIPRGGNRTEAHSFVQRSRPWLEHQLQRQQTQPRLPAAWHLGTEILFRGEPARIAPAPAGGVTLGPVTLPVADPANNLRPAIERSLRALAAVELPLRVQELASQHQLSINRVTVRNQRGRWGSCSRHRNISLNWRLIQTPPFVCDYIILHELAHLREMNHSRRFWREVERLCPDYFVAEKWLKTNRQLLR